MNPGRFFMPNLRIGMPSTMGTNFLPPRSGLGLFGRLTSSLRTFNWSGLLSGANKTLNVVNQTIPLVRQAGPMINNMKSMLRLAKVFGNETTNNNRSNNINIINNSNTNNLSNINASSDLQENNLVQKKEVLDNNLAQKKEVLDNNYPNFFV